MSLKPGERLGRYEVLSALGAGGMGEVWRARDTRLDRDVALKVLPEAFASDPERLSRFEREAKVLASLNHPHIGGIHGLEEANGQLALVLELIEGPTLEDRIKRGPIPIAEALRMAAGIAEAVEAAHERGIIHRDLKPANVKIGAGETVKVLDFGLAKALQGVDGGSSSPLDSDTPTRTATTPGLILGTPAYMSPEQARGEPVDGRTDVWAFGCILFEMLTGRRLFAGTRSTDILVAVLKDEPDFSALPADTPNLIRRLLRRCLEKDRRERLRHIGDARADLQESLAPSRLADAARQSAADETGKRPRSTRRAALAVAALIATAAAAGLAGWLAASHDVASVARPGTVAFEIHDVDGVGPLGSPRQIAISRDGTRVLHNRGGINLRSLEHSNKVQARWDSGVGAAFFSPDGESIGFEGLQRVSVRGGTPTRVAAFEYTRFYGGTWGPQDRIVVATDRGLHSVSAGGGPVELLVAPDPEQRELFFTSPEILPNGKFVLFAVVPRDSHANPQVAAYDFESRQRKIVLPVGEGPRYSPTGHLLFVADGQLLAVGFDPDTLETRGEAGVVLEDRVARANFDISDTGTLVYEPLRVGTPSHLVWVARDGRQEPISAPSGWVYPRISPDGKRIAGDFFRTLSAKERDIYIWDLERENLSRLTDDAGEDSVPHWSADGSRVFFSSNRRGPFSLYSRAADGTGEDELVFATEISLWLTGLTPDGRQLLADNGDIAAFDIEEPRRSRALLATPAAEGRSSISPDGRWLAYDSDTEGENAVYVGPYPDVGSRKWKISSGGGRHPLWSSHGDEIYFVGPSGNMMAAQVELTPTFAPGPVTELFPNSSEQPFLHGGARSYDVSPLDGRFLMVKSMGKAPPASLVVVLNWFQELRAKVPVN